MTQPKAIPKRDVINEHCSNFILCWKRNRRAQSEMLRRVSAVWSLDTVHLAGQGSKQTINYTRLVGFTSMYDNEAWKHERIKHGCIAFHYPVKREPRLVRPWLKSNFDPFIGFELSFCFEPITEKSVTFLNLGLISIFCVLFKKLCHWPNSLNHGTRVSEVDKKCLPNWLLTINPSAFCV